MTRGVRLDQLMEMHGRRKRQGACHLVELRFALLASLGDGCCHAARRQSRYLAIGADERQSCFAQLGFSDRPRRGRLASAERSTPTMIAEPLTCLVRRVRSFAAMINHARRFRPSLIVACCGAELHDHWSSIVGAMIPRGEGGLIISRIVIRMIMEPLLVRGYRLLAGSRKGNRRQPGDATGLGRAVRSSVRSCATQTTSTRVHQGRMGGVGRTSYNALGPRILNRSYRTSEHFYPTASSASRP